MRCAGFEGSYLNKAGAAREGEAVFWRTSRLRLVAERPLAVRQLFTQLVTGSSGSALARRHAQLLPMLEASEPLRIALSKVGQMHMSRTVLP